MEWDTPSQPGPLLHVRLQPESQPNLPPRWRRSTAASPGPAAARSARTAGTSISSKSAIAARASPCAADPTPSPAAKRTAAERGGEWGADTVRLTISVDGGSSVEYFTNQNERLFCGDTVHSLHDVTCTAEFFRGSQARIQRTLGLPKEEEARWRLAGWEGACQGLDADTEPRGGQCILTMDEDKDVSVNFARRAMITVTHTGPPQLLNRWGIDYLPAAQKGGGNPLTLRGTVRLRHRLRSPNARRRLLRHRHHCHPESRHRRRRRELRRLLRRLHHQATAPASSSCESDAEVTYIWIY